MKKSKKKLKSNLGLLGWMRIECMVVVIGSILIYELTDFITNYVLYKNYDYKPISGIGMFFPMSILVYAITTAFSRTLYHHISELTNGISKIAKGEFNVKLNESSGGPLKEVYHNFNIMCDELNSIDTLRNDFANEFSHEFRTPIASINGFSNLLLDGNCSQEQVTKYLSIIASESERLVALTQSQLLLSKLDSQNIVINKTSYYLDEQIRQCAIMLVSEWEKKKLEVSFELPKIPFFGNADMMNHLWINLLTNAIKYTPENGEIFIQSRSNDSEIEISISDTGIGMTDEQIEQIFKKYYQVENSISVSGLGLGLPIVKRIIMLNNGQLKVTSTPGEGSTFTVVLPLENA
ncbi:MULTISPECIES: HAMP domain-containing sensor histidine kinase [Clostridium]|uniref:Heme sensor protein HssS n=1 Tax=Clostridium frigoriphilum TaxID=443253 RepID=A0ABU7UUY0_9CLOT|nr:HAMP domain-containing sensor histidine kinase [Clostridium sp. DSM 17811]MBU3099415.1 HAMP domain-containing histidine kinase [Clostridium sp. DSM 17811]